MNERESKPADSAEGEKEQYGEGNYTASRRYNESTKRFVESGQVDEAATSAAPQNDAEARELERAEQAGRERAKEEDPALDPPSQAREGDQAPSG